MTRLEFLKGMKLLSNYYLKSITDDQVGTWYDAFKNIQPEVFYKAIKDYGVNNKYFPTVGALMLCVKRETEKYYISLVQNSSIDSEKKEYLCDLIEWYTLSGEYPPKLVQELNLLKNSPKELENKGCEG